MNGEHRPPSTHDPAHGLMSWLHEEPRLRILVAPNGDIAWMSRAAEALPDRVFPFAAAGGAGGERRLDPVIAGRLASLTQERSHYLISTASADWVIWAQAVRTCEEDGSIGHPFVGLTLRQRGETPELEALAEACHLTRAEVRIIAALMAGQDTATAARGLGISLHTLRTHVRHAYRKLGVTTREGLFAGALAFMHP